MILAGLLLRLRVRVLRKMRRRSTKSTTKVDGVGGDCGGSGDGKVTTTTAASTTRRPPVCSSPSNDRERERQLQVNDAFNTLRRILPSHPPNKKMSKQEILRTAVRYIRILETIKHNQQRQAELEEDNELMMM